MGEVQTTTPSRATVAQGKPSIRIHGIVWEKPKVPNRKMCLLAHCPYVCSLGNQCEACEILDSCLNDKVFFNHFLLKK